jgi:hypothetical protein
MKKITGSKHIRRAKRREEKHRQIKERNTKK